MKHWFVLFLTIFLSSCLGGESVDPVAVDPEFAGINPDQKALPKDGADQSQPPTSEQAPVNGQSTAVTPPSAPQEAPSSEAASAIPPALPVEQVSPAESAAQSPTQQSTSSEPGVEIGTSVGSGPQVRYIKAFELNVRSKPNRHSKIVGRLKGKDEVHVSIHGGWSKLDDGRWVRTRWLVKSPPDKLVNMPPDEEGKPSRKKRMRHNQGSKRAKRGSKS